MKRHVIMHEINDELVQARRTFDDWKTFLSDYADDEIESWDDVYEVIIWSYLTDGDFTEFVNMVMSKIATTIAVSDN